MNDCDNINIGIANIGANAERPGDRGYACVENLLDLTETGDTKSFVDNLRLLFGADTVTQAQALIAKQNRFMGLSAPGLTMAGCTMHGKLPEAYDKIHVRAARVRRDLNALNRSCLHGEYRVA